MSTYFVLSQLKHGNLYVYEENHPIVSPLCDFTSLDELNKFCNNRIRQPSKNADVLDAYTCQGHIVSEYESKYQRITCTCQERLRSKITKGFFSLFPSSSSSSRRTMRTRRYRF